MYSSQSSISPKALGWALLSQVFWIPLLAIDLHDRWIAHQADITPPGQPLPPSPVARATPFSLNDLLAGARSPQQLAGHASQVFGSSAADPANLTSNRVGVLLSSAGSGPPSLLNRPYSTTVESPAVSGRSSGPSLPFAAPSPPARFPALTGRAFSRSQLLGGPIGLSDLQEGPMGPLALAERALRSSSGDPLAPLPSMWREPMRQALLKLPGAPQQVGIARMVYVPSRSVIQPVEVPLALQSDGSVDILQAPANTAVLAEIDSWSRQQRLPASGSLVPAVVHLHPLSPSVTSTSAAVTSSPPASPSASTISRRRSPAAALTPQVQPSSELPSRASSAAQSTVVIPIPSEASAAKSPLNTGEPPAASPTAPSPSAVPIPIQSEAPTVSTTPLQSPAPSPAGPIAAASTAESPVPPASPAP